MLKKLVYIHNSDDRNWLEKLVRTQTSNDLYIYVAMTFEARVLAESLGLKYNAYEAFRHEMDKQILLKKSLFKTYNWSAYDEFYNDSIFKNLLSYRNVPTLKLLGFHFTLFFWESFQAYELIEKILLDEKPTLIIKGKRKNPYSREKSRLFSLAGSNGVEQEVISVLCNNTGIQLKEFNTESEKLFFSVKKEIKKVKTYLKNGFEKLSNKKQYNTIVPFQKGKKRLLFFIYGGMYFDKIKPLLINLASIVNYEIRVVMISGELKKEEIAELSNINILTNDISDFYKDNKVLSRKTKRESIELFHSVVKDKKIKGFFSDEYGSYFDGLISNIFQRIIIQDLPNLIINLDLANHIFEELKPDFVFNHGATNPDHGYINAIARIRGIPDLSMGHGIGLKFNIKRIYFLSLYFCTVSEVTRSAYKDLVGADVEFMLAIGNLQLHKQLNESIVKSKESLELGFDKYKKTCLFLDSSGWTQTSEYRHTTFETLKNIIKLANKFSDLQIIYRVHHGFDFAPIEKYINSSLSPSNLFFQASPNPLFSDIIGESDFVIAHHTSGITESLVCGVPVIYDCCFGEIQEEYLNVEMISVVRNYEELEKSVSRYYRDLFLREEVQAKSMDFFKKILNYDGSDKCELMKELIIKLVNTPKSDQIVGLEKWDTQIETLSSQWKPVT